MEVNKYNERKFLFSFFLMHLGAEDRRLLDEEVGSVEMF